MYIHIFSPSWFIANHTKRRSPGSNRPSKYKLRLHHIVTYCQSVTTQETSVLYIQYAEGLAYASAYPTLTAMGNVIATLDWSRQVQPVRRSRSQAWNTGTPLERLPGRFDELSVFACVMLTSKEHALSYHQHIEAISTSLRNFITIISPDSLSTVLVGQGARARHRILDDRSTRLSYLN